MLSVTWYTIKTLPVQSGLGRAKQGGWSLVCTWNYTICTWNCTEENNNTLHSLHNTAILVLSS